MNVTIKDIALAANLSNQAVSAVLNGKTNSRVSAANREKILEIARRMNYVPNYGSRQLRNQNTNAVALLIGEERQKYDPHMKDMFIQLITDFGAIGYTCFLSELSYDAAANVKTVRELVARGVDGFVASGSPIGAPEIKAVIESSGKPCIGYGNQDFADRHVLSDTAEAVEAIIRFFLSRNRTNFKMILNPVSPPGVPGTGARFQGMFRALPDTPPEILMRDHVVLISQRDQQERNSPLDLFEIGYEMTRNLLQDDPSVQAIFYASDPYAIGGAKYLIERGIRIGEDIALAGFNNEFAVSTYPFPISSAAQNTKEICRHIVREFFSGKPVSTKVSSKVFLRGS